eukprot:83088_1
MVLFESKAISQLTLFRRKVSVFARWDVFPFAILYAVGALTSVFPEILHNQLISTSIDTLSTEEIFSNHSWVYWVGFILLPVTAFCHILVFLGSHWSLGFHCMVSSRLCKSIEEAEFVHVVPPLHCGKSSLCALVVQSKSGGQRSVSFEFQKIKYSFNEVSERFEELNFPVARNLDFYFSSTGFEDDESVRQIRDQYGANEFSIPMPTFTEMFKEHATAPFFIFQVVCVALWSLDEYVMYCLFTLLMLVVFEATMVKRRLKNVDIVRQMRVPAFDVMVFRGDEWVTVKSSDLFPGDIVSVTRSTKDSVCPCDILLLQGTCVLNEALLTGESTPQIKEALDPHSFEDNLDLLGAHKNNYVSGGTHILQTVPPARTDSGAVQSPPNGGAVGFVLKTGFSTNQGKLLRTILFSTERVSVNNTEALLFILCLLVFAIGATIYVLIKGLEDENRSRYKLALNCIMIITMVVPPELPMVMSLAVNSSLLFLSKHKIFCTEGFRIPLAGKVSWCCFDKTGTLTSDAFEVQGVAGIAQQMESRNSRQNGDSSASHSPLASLDRVPNDALYVIAGCHSLTQIDRETVGDPLEKAAIEAMRWNLSGDVCSSRNNAHTVRRCHRFPFSSHLRRMSCIVKIAGPDAGGCRVVSKGAAEVMRSRFFEVPNDYDETYRHYSHQGCRVLALGFKDVRQMSVTSMRTVERDEAESNLVFAGFLVLRSPMKEGSLETVKSLRASSHHVVMITGDHALTACSVASELMICLKPLLSLVHHGPRPSGISQNDLEWPEEPSSDEESRRLLDIHHHVVSWQTMDGDTYQGLFPFRSAKLVHLASKFDLCMTGDALRYLRESDDISEKDLAEIIISVKVFARMSPYQKEFLLTSLKERGITTLMCGDGTNDVGALKQAHVGVALVSEDQLEKIREQDELSQRSREQRQSRRHTPARTQPASPSTPASHSRRKKRGKRGKREAKEVASPKPAEGQSSTSSNRRQANLMDRLEEADEEPQPVRLGDASIAAPFTSRNPLISSVLHVIQQGRCTLVTTQQMYRILALNCLISAYSMSALTMEGVKFGDTQSTITGILVAFLFMLITQAKPLQRLSAQRPFPTIFSLYTAVSLVGQFAVHLLVLLKVKELARPFAPTDEDSLDPDTEFKPNVMNTAIFLASATMTAATFVSNYVGYPFMTSMRDNRNFMKVLGANFLVVFVLVFNIFPEFNDFMELAPLPDSGFASDLATWLAADVVAVVIWEHVTRWLLVPRPKIDAEFQRRMEIEAKKDE